jgi:hypothetical protein
VAPPQKKRTNKKGKRKKTQITTEEIIPRRIRRTERAIRKSQMDEVVLAKIIDSMQALKDDVPLTATEYMLLKDLRKKHGDEKLWNIISNNFDKRKSKFLEHPVHYLHSVISSMQYKEDIKRTIESLVSKKGL